MSEWKTEKTIDENGEDVLRFRTDDLLRAANEILGGIVIDAYIYQDRDYLYDDLDDTVKRLNKMGISYCCIEPEDGFPVTVVLDNGKKFKIWASEWGGIHSVKSK